jgi:hypothetical protein
MLPMFEDYIQENQYYRPLYVSKMGPVCQEIIRKKYRIRTYGFVSKIRVKQKRRNIFTNAFIKELSLNPQLGSPYMELYATFCASYLRH